MLTPATLRGLVIAASAVGAALAFDDAALLLALVLGVSLITLSGWLRLPIPSALLIELAVTTLLTLAVLLAIGLVWSALWWLGQWGWVS